jgi:UDP-3-O-[3-hydroxymyristoyl] glucosamine N-acyltransferase
MAGPFTLDELARRTGGRVEGDGTVLIERVATLKSAGTGAIAFLSNRKYRADVESSAAVALIVADADASLSSRPRLIHANPYACFARVAGLFDSGIHQDQGIHASATISPTATLGANISIGAHVAIGANVVIGEGGVIYPNVTIYPGVVIGRNVIIHAGAVIGSDGFGFAADAGAWVKIPQTGRVVIGDNVEIGAGTTIDRAALEDTVIEDGVKLDNQIQIGHNVKIGAHTAMAGCVGVAGSASIGRHCTFGGGAIVLGHLTIADHVHVTAGSLVTKSIGTAGTYGASLPATAHREWLKNAAHLRNLDAMEERIRALENKIRKLEEDA